jgi:hypothetical protein
MSAIKIIVAHPHIESEGGVLEYCATYRLSEAVLGVIDGEVGYEPDPGLSDAEIRTELINMIVAHANLQTSNVEAFTISDVITWEL